MTIRRLPPLPGLGFESAPRPDEPGYCEWVESVVFSPEGVDRALIWENLHRTPAERLRVLQDFVDTFHGARATAHSLR